MEELEQRESPSCIFLKFKTFDICWFSVRMKGLSSQDFAIKAQSSPGLWVLLLQRVRASNGSLSYAGQMFKSFRQGIDLP